MHDQQLAPIHRAMHELAMDLEIAEHRAAEFAQVLVVIAGDVDDARALLGLAQDDAQHVVVFLRPEEALAHRPQVDDVADQKQIVDFDGFQKLEQQVGPAAARPQVHIGYEHRSQPDLLSIVSVAHICPEVARLTRECPSPISPL
jgi:hypothetical protein